jgi:peptide/nickel transport system permease protein
MHRFILRRLFESFIVIWLVTILVFLGVYRIGDPAALLIPPEADRETVEKVRRELGLDLPAHEQYARFAWNALRGDLGESFVFRESAVSVILERLPATLELAVCAMALAIIVGLPLGLLAGSRGDGVLDRSLMVGSTLGYSLPSFWVGMLLILTFSVRLGWLPALGRGETVAIGGIELSVLTLDGLEHLLLPAVNLAIFPMAFIIRMARTGLREALALDFVKFARAQGYTPWQVIRIHVLKYISIPIITFVGVYLGVLIAFAVVTESVFAWPGMGKLIIDSINQLDRPVIVAYVMVSAVIFVLINLIVDLLYSALDPRVAGAR